MGTEEYILGGDVILKVDDTLLRDMKSVVKVVRALRVGQTVKLAVLRDGTIIQLDVTLSERPLLPGDLRLMQAAGSR